MDMDITTSGSRYSQRERQKVSCVKMETPKTSQAKTPTKMPAPKTLEMGAEGCTGGVEAKKIGENALKVCVFKCLSVLAQLCNGVSSF